MSNDLPTELKVADAKRVKALECHYETPDEVGERVDYCSNLVRKAKSLQEKISESENYK